MPNELAVALAGFFLVLTTILQSWFQEWRRRTGENALSVKTDAVATTLSQKTEDVAASLATKTDAAAAYIASSLSDRLSAKIESIMVWQTNHEKDDLRRFGEMMSLLNDIKSGR